MVKLYTAQCETSRRHRKTYGKHASVSRQILLSHVHVSCNGLCSVRFAKDVAFEYVHCHRERCTNNNTSTTDTVVSALSLSLTKYVVVTGGIAFFLCLIEYQPLS